MTEPGQVELERAGRTLGAAQARLRRSRTATRMLIAGVTPIDGRLVCLIEAPSLDVVRRLVVLALLPAGRIREITHVDLPGHNDEAPADPQRSLPWGRHPGGDLAPGAEAELVEDVVDVGLDGPLRKE